MTGNLESNLSAVKNHVGQLQSDKNKKIEDPKLKKLQTIIENMKPKKDGETDDEVTEKQWYKHSHSDFDS